MLSEALRKNHEMEWQLQLSTAMVQELEAAVYHKEKDLMKARQAAGEDAGLQITHLEAALAQERALRARLEQAGVGGGVAGAMRKEVERAEEWRRRAALLEEREARAARELERMKARAEAAEGEKQALLERARREVSGHGAQLADVSEWQAAAAAADEERARAVEAREAEAARVREYQHEVRRCAQRVQAAEAAAEACRPRLSEPRTGAARDELREMARAPPDAAAARAEVRALRARLAGEEGALRAASGEIASLRRELAALVPQLGGKAGAGGDAAGGRGEYHHKYLLADYKRQVAEKKMRELEDEMVVMSVQLERGGGADLDSAGPGPFLTPAPSEHSVSAATPPAARGAVTPTPVAGVSSAYSRGSPAGTGTRGDLSLKTQVLAASLRREVEKAVAHAAMFAGTAGAHVHGWRRAGADIGRAMAAVRGVCGDTAAAGQSDEGPGPGAGTTPWEEDEVRGLREQRQSLVAQLEGARGEVAALRAAAEEGVEAAQLRARVRQLEAQRAEAQKSEEEASAQLEEALTEVRAARGGGAGDGAREEQQVREDLFQAQAREELDGDGELLREALAREAQLKTELEEARASLETAMQAAADAREHPSRGRDSGGGDGGGGGGTETEALFEAEARERRLQQQLHEAEAREARLERQLQGQRTPEDADAEVRELYEQLEEARGHAAKLQRDLDTAAPAQAARAEEAAEASEALAAQYDEARAREDRLREDLAGAQRELEAAAEGREERIEELEMDLASAQDEAAIAQAEATSAQEELASAQARLAEVRQELVAARQELAILQGGGLEGPPPPEGWAAKVQELEKQLQVERSDRIRDLVDATEFAEAADRRAAQAEAALAEAQSAKVGSAEPKPALSEWNPFPSEADLPGGLVLDGEIVSAGELLGLGSSSGDEGEGGGFLIEDDDGKPPQPSPVGGAPPEEWIQVATNPLGGWDGNGVEWTTNPLGGEETPASTARSGVDTPVEAPVEEPVGASPSIKERMRAFQNL